MPDTLAEPAGIPGGRIMVVYFNHRAALIEVILRFGFTNDILRDPDFAEYEGVELRDARPDPAEGCLMPPDGATIIIAIPETELLPYEVLAVGWQADGFRHAGFGYREFIVPARIVNRYDRRVYCLDQLDERLRARPGQAQLRQVPEAPEAPLPAAAGGAEHPAATMPLDGDQVAPRQPASLPAGPDRDSQLADTRSGARPLWWKPQPNRRSVMTGPEPNEPPTYPVVPVAEAVAWLAAHDPNWIGPGVHRHAARRAARSHPAAERRDRLPARAPEGNRREVHRGPGGRGRRALRAHSGRVRGRTVVYRRSRRSP